MHFSKPYGIINPLSGYGSVWLERTAGGREVAGSNPVTPIPWQGHGRRSDPSGGLRKRETVYCGVSFLCNRKLRSYYTKTFRGDVQLAVRYIMLCIPLGRKCAASAHFVFRKKERHRKTRQNQFMILPGFVTAETAGFEPACPKGANAFRVRLVMTTSIRLRKVWQPSAIFAKRICNLRCSSRASA